MFEGHTDFVNNVVITKDNQSFSTSNTELILWSLEEKKL